MAVEAKQKSTRDMQAMMEVYMKVGTPGEPHKRLARLEGSWTTKTTAKAPPVSARAVFMPSHSIARRSALVSSAGANQPPNSWWTKAFTRRLPVS